VVVTDAERVVVTDGVELTVAVVERVRAGEAEEDREPVIVDVVVLLAAIVAEVDIVELGDSVPFAEALNDELPVDVAERVLLCVARGDPDSVGVVVLERETDIDVVEVLLTETLFVGIDVVVIRAVFVELTVDICVTVSVAVPFDEPVDDCVVLNDREGEDVVVGDRVLVAV
jgi:hypothetical protein